jgi:hypothetical protein
MATSKGVETPDCVHLTTDEALDRFILYLKHFLQPSTLHSFNFMLFFFSFYFFHLPFSPLDEIYRIFCSCLNPRKSSEKDLGYGFFHFFKSVSYDAPHFFLFPFVQIEVLDHKPQVILDNKS